MVSRRETAEAGDQTNSEREAYAKPQLTVYGDAVQLTGIKTSGALDGSTHSNTSDLNLKDQFAEIDVHEILHGVMSLPISSWTYKDERPDVRHIGPMAQDFAATFGIGDDDRKIKPIDANGVALASIQALYSMVRERDEEIESLRAELEGLKSQLLKTSPQTSKGSRTQK